MNYLDVDPHLIKFTLDKVKNERDKAVEDLKKVIIRLRNL